MLNITTSNFTKVLNQGRPLVLIFTGVNCAGCDEAVKVLSDIELELSRSSTILFGQCDAYHNITLAQHFLVEHVPTILILKKGVSPIPVLPNKFQVTQAILRVVGSI